MVEIAKGLEQPLGQRLGIAAPDGTVEHHFKQFIIRNRRRTTLGKALAQALSMGLAMVLDSLGRSGGWHRGAAGRAWIEPETGQALFLESLAKAGHAPRIRQGWLTRG